MSCDYEGRDELRIALLQSTSLLWVLFRESKERDLAIEAQIARNKLALKTEVSIQLPQSSLETSPKPDTP